MPELGSGLGPQGKGLKWVESLCPDKWPWSPSLGFCPLFILDFRFPTCKTFPQRGVLSRSQGT